MCLSSLQPTVQSRILCHNHIHGIRFDTRLVALGRMRVNIVVNCQGTMIAWLIDNWLTLIVVGLGVTSFLIAFLVSSVIVARNSDED